MTPVSLVAFLLFLWALLRSRYGTVLLGRIDRIAPSAPVVRLCGPVLVLLFIGQLLLLIGQIHHENGPPISDWEQRLPIPVYVHDTYRQSVHWVFCAIGFSLGALETLCLGIIFVGARRDVKALGRPLAVALVGALAILSIAAPALSTKDPYEYILAGILGFHAYSPGPDPFAHTAYAALEHRIPLRGVLYGPLWLALDTAVTGAFTSVYPKLLALRVFNASLLLILLWMSARARASRPVLLILALNPAAWYYLVVNLHVETQGLIAVTAAFLAARRSWGVRAMMLVTVAALIKIVFIVAGAAVFVKFSGVLRRLALWAGATALVLAISYATSGGAYFSDITGHLSFYAARASATSRAVF